MDKTESKAKLAVLVESFETHRQLVGLADAVIAFLSREYGESLPGERPDVEALLKLAQAASTPAAPDIAERRRQITLEVEKLETRITELYKEDRLLGEEVPRG